MPTAPPVPRQEPPIGPRAVLLQLLPQLRPTALAMAAGDPSRIRVLSRARFEILDIPKRRP